MLVILFKGCYAVAWLNNNYEMNLDRTGTPVILCYSVTDCYWLVSDVH